MLKVGGWLSGAKGHMHHGTTRSLNALDELSNIEDAMAAVSHIMNDDVDSAEEALNKGHSPFHQLGKGVVTFMKATLGFEQDIMRQASDTLSDAENSAYRQQRHAKNASTYQSPIFPPGTEYAVCQAEAQLMSAIVGVLNESLTEAIKSFYKLRKAYLTLESIMEAERKYLSERSTSSLASTSSSRSSRPSSNHSIRSNAPSPKHSAPSFIVAGPSSTLGKAAISEKSLVPSGNPSSEENEDDDFFDADEDHAEVETPMEYVGHLGVPTEDGRTLELDNSKKELTPRPGSIANPPIKAGESSMDLISETIKELEDLALTETVKANEDISAFGDHPVDMFIISGSNFCFGILSLLISLVPPAFSTLLKIVGFKGDRERGIQMLWRATKFHNIHGAMAGLVLFGYYNAIVGFCDIIPQQGEGSYPKARCKVLLADMRKRYPKSHLWLLEEARMLASEKELEKSIEYMDITSESPLKQLEALRWFERSLNTMYIHDYAGTSSAFQKCITLNNWSHGLYYYISGASHVELYRRNKTKNPAEAKKQAELAKDLFKKVRSNIGKKKFMARQLPFDVFVNRKIQKWEARAAEWKCDFIDAIGVSPFEEMIYFWNGYKRMRADHLEASLEALAWSESKENLYWGKEGLDEMAIKALLTAATLRSLDRTGEARKALEEQILSQDRSLFKGGLKDNWTAPTARYEMAAIVYGEAERAGPLEKQGALLGECRNWLEEVARWESYDLDARIGMKVTTGKSTLRRYGVEC
ncbi:hypothetical protein GQ43DRAFT_442032 [Delitschia confertaspora ATCC 74209]|uniref:Inclusion body clearance protein IML2 n=1 Tax=Delitschia confertaspora ATCC 74209 TaxID=1513339 RepID=A0A9P4JKH0_9PLEO|nr:hypothetical protein GQ43DRAFT_442032 [Delitschia confertaspora ATCC 74209]